MSIFSPRLSAILFIGLAVHELGHAHAARWHGVPVRGIYLFPWFAGWCMYRARIMNWWVGSFISLTGPTYQLLYGIGLFATGTVTGDEVILFGAPLEALGALINLIPVGSHDGYKVVRAIRTPARISRLNRRGRSAILAAYVTLIALSLAVTYAAFPRDIVFNPLQFAEKMSSVWLWSAVNYMGRLLV
ncbi:hypothetical protein HYV30_00595 [Candidatus Kaiserbacteria bacterium]|nr:hypothetical protein [Candidatus Kaiserbacteria bacterium]